MKHRCLTLCAVLAAAPLLSPLALGWWPWQRGKVWAPGVQAYTFRKLTFFETVDRAAALGLEAVEMYPAQALGGGLDGKTHFSMDAATRSALGRKLRDAGIRLTAYGVVTPATPQQWRELFVFADEMGIRTIVTEPSAEQLDLVEDLAEEFCIEAALHNHAQPARYWSPQSVLDACRGRSQRLGACVDTGHWIRSGIDPVEGVTILGDRVKALHLKDISEAGMNGHCVPFGTGVADLPALFAQLKRQNFAGPVSIEYEHRPDNPFPDVRRCVVAFRQLAQLSAAQLETGPIPPLGMTEDIARTWAFPDPGDNGRWQHVQDADTSGYTDTTDDGEGTVEANGLGFPNEHYPNAFDNDSKTKWCIKTPTSWIQYRYPDSRAVRVTAYTITTANDAPARDPRMWRLLGSNDGGTAWTEVDRREQQTWQRRFQKRLFTVASPGEYRLYKLDITENSGDPTTSQLAEIELLVESAPAAGE